MLRCNTTTDELLDLDDLTDLDRRHAKHEVESETASGPSTVDLVVDGTQYERSFTGSSSLDNTRIQVSQSYVRALNRLGLYSSLSPTRALLDGSSLSGDQLKQLPVNGNLISETLSARFLISLETLSEKA